MNHAKIEVTTTTLLEVILEVFFVFILIEDNVIIKIIIFKI
jgi:hypothetical protein